MFEPRMATFFRKVSGYSTYAGFLADPARAYAFLVAKVAKCTRTIAPAEELDPPESGNVTTYDLLYDAIGRARPATSVIVQ
ncbi:hypothetical protein BSU04_07705 [Caballeronia sordidicola]|uniref:Uncharacterized protein n=1 Tax=Caballeronia sordidicola TaxID=196367 RepID=A0A226X8K8_CABSO|nr:hypothetical protein BSU04_07705 [Caballeronia sordidicola]